MHKSKKRLDKIRLFGLIAYISCLYVTKSCTFLQVPEEYTGTDVAPHGCIRLGRYANSRSWHWVFSNGRLDPTYWEGLNCYYVLSCYYSCNTKYLAHFTRWRSQFALQCLVPIWYNEDSCLRADQYSPGKIAYAYLLTPWSRVLLEKLTGFAANQEIPHILWNQPESSLPYSQAPAICPYPEPTPSSPHNPFPLPQDPS